LETEALKKKLLLIVYVLGLLALFYILSVLLVKVSLAVGMLTVAILLAYVLAPLVSFFNNPIIITIPLRISLGKIIVRVRREEKRVTVLKKGLPRVVSISLVYLIMAVILFITISYVVPIINHEFFKLFSNLPNMGEKIRQLTNDTMAWLGPRLPEGASEFLQPILNKAVDELQKWLIASLQHLMTFTTRLFTLLAEALITPLITFYILMDVDKYKKGFLSLIPAHRHGEINGILHEIDMMLGRYIRGQLIVCLCIGISVTIALKLFDIDYAYLIGAFAGIIDIIPYVGVIIGMIPAVFLALVNKSLLTAILLLMTLEAIHWSEGHIIVPAVVGHSVRLPPLVVLVALIMGAQLGGVMGMLVAVPVAAIVRVMVNHYIRMLAPGSLKMD
jgi:predicted PurR-regulated permease PerM